MSLATDSGLPLRVPTGELRSCSVILIAVGSSHGLLARWSSQHGFQKSATPAHHTHKVSDNKEKSWRQAGSRTDITNAIDGFAADSRGFTNSSRGWIHKNIRRIRGWVHNGFTNGFATDSRQIDSRQMIRESSREFARVRESSREFARVRENSRRMRGRIHNG